MSELRFVVYGKLCSNNLVTRRVGNLSLKSREARESQARVKSAALAAVLKQRWKPLAANVEVELIAYGSRADADNIPKVVLDGMKGIAFVDDRVITRLVVEKRRDKFGERYEVAVRPRA